MRTSPHPNRGQVRSPSKRWSRHVTETSHALDLDANVFTWSDPKRIARSLKRSAERSRARKAGAYRSAISMLTFYLNRGGRKLPAARKRTLERAKDELRGLFGRPSGQRRTQRARRRAP
jgi:Protein of unknown function (DUF3175)